MTKKIKLKYIILIAALFIVCGFRVEIKKTEHKDGNHSMTVLPDEQVPFVISDEKSKEPIYCANFIDSIENEILILSESARSYYKKLNYVPSLIREVFPDIYFFQDVGWEYKSRYLCSYYNREIVSLLTDFNFLKTQKRKFTSFELAYCFALLYDFSGKNEIDPWSEVVKIEKIDYFDSSVDTVKTIKLNRYNHEVQIISQKYRNYKVDTTKLLLYFNKCDEIVGYKDISNENYYYGVLSHHNSINCK